MMLPLSICPACQGALHISALQCPDCGLELRNNFEFSPFQKLSSAQNDFLLAFLRYRGNLKDLQNDLDISYPTARKKLDELLAALGLAETADNFTAEQEIPDMRNWFTDPKSTKASEIIKSKLKEAGGKVVVHTARGLPCEIRAGADGLTFYSDKLPATPPWRFEVFDVIVELLAANGGRARKGNGRNYRLGDPDCDDTTVVGYIGTHYSGKTRGDFVYDPVFALAAIMEWADIAINGRGELILTAAYRAKL